MDSRSKRKEEITQTYQSKRIKFRAMSCHSLEEMSSAETWFDEYPFSWVADGGEYLYTAILDVPTFVQLQSVKWLSNPTESALEARVSQKRKFCAFKSGLANKVKKVAHAKSHLGVTSRSMLPSFTSPATKSSRMRSIMGKLPLDSTIIDPQTILAKQEDSASVNIVHMEKKLNCQYNKGKRNLLVRNCIVTSAPDAMKNLVTKLNRKG